MGDIVNKTKLENASVDCQTLEDCVNGPAETKVTSRLGRQYWTLATIDSKVANVVSQADYALILIQEAQDQIVAIADTAQAQFDVKMTDLESQANTAINDWNTAIQQITTESLPALAVTTANTQTQQAINDSVGAKWYAKGGGYPINYRVMLDNGDIVKSTVPSNTANPNTDMTGWVKVNDASQIFDASGKSQQFLNDLQQVVDTRRYGVVANTVLDMTPFIHDAMSQNPTACKFYLPEGDILANIVVPRNYITFIGQGLGKTKLIGFDKSKPTIDYNKKLYMGLKDISVHQKHDATAMIIKAWDTRYISYDNAEVLQLPDTNGNYMYSVDGLDLSNDTNYWTGYLYFKESRFNRCKNGIKTSGDLVSACYFNSCVISWNGEFGAIINNVVGGGMNNCDIATNGQLAIALNKYDETKYGGVWVRGRNFNIDGSWHEFNRSKFAEVDYPNDIYIYPDSVNVTETNPRSQRNNQGGYLISKSQGQQDQNAYTDTVIDSGMGQSKYQNLIKNGAFKYGISGWNQTNLLVTDYSIEATDLPLGFETGLKILSSGGNKGVYQNIYESGKTGNIIDNLTKWIGKTITLTCWVKNLTSISNSIRVGFDTAASGTNVYFSTGNYIASTPNEWVKVVLTHKISGSEGRIFAGLRNLQDCIITGFRVQIGARVADYEPKNINELGGDIYGTLDTTVLKIQGKNISFASVKPSAAATKGDICYNINVTTGAEIGWAYNGSTWISLGRSIESEFASAANFTSAASSLNTAQKWQGRTLMNSGNGKLYFATGGSPTDAWRASDGSGDITPA